MTLDNTTDRTESLVPASDPRRLAREHQARAQEDHPKQIGPYKVLEVLGEGGMGTVYLAEQEKPIHRRVALKIIKLGMDTKSVIARFEAEREALALMNHPNVAKVFDAGATEQGRPYFVMEYAEGVPITKYCDEHRLTLPERLNLFTQVCQAVQHAHQKGIIHRDIKPSNVLVTEVDGKPSIKVIDFGIAKATQQKLTEATMFTEQGALVGTPAYMSPEQADPLCQDIDTRTDIYSLGVLLYELLVGALPFDPKTLRGVMLGELQRMIREVDPPKPSTKLVALGDASTTVAESRGMTRTSLARQLRGDLDWIVMKCLEKDRARRYDTANALVMELQRYLNNEPVLAGPPSATYRVKKFVRRNKVGVAGVCAVVAALAIGLVISDLQRRRAVRAEVLAEQRLIETETALAHAEASERAALAARDEAQAVTAFLTDTLASVDPEKHGKDVTVREVLDIAAERIDEKFADNPLLHARLQYTVGRTYRSLAQYGKAQTHLADAAALYHRLKGKDHQHTLNAIHNLSSVFLDRGDYSEAEAQIEATLEIQRRVLGEEHPETLMSMSILALSLHNLGRYAEAEALHRQTLEIQRRVLGEEHPGTLASLNNLANSFHAQGHHAEAESLFRQTLEIQRHVLGEEHPDTLGTMQNVAGSLIIQGRYDEAEALHRLLLEIRRRVLGEEHAHTLSSMNNLGESLRVQGRYDEAEALHRQTLEIRRRVLGEKHPDTLGTMNNMAVSLANQGRYAESESLTRQALEIQRHVLGEEHPDTLSSMNNLANRLKDQGRYAEAEAFHRQTLEIRRRVLGEEHPHTLSSMHNLASILSSQRRYTEAEALSAPTVDRAAKVLPSEHPHLADYRKVYGQILLKLDRLDEAEKQLIESYPILSAAGSMQQLANETAQALVELYEARHAAEPDAGYDLKADEWRAKIEEETETQGTQPQRNEDT